MGVNKLFVAFGFISASCCLSLGHIARYVPSAGTTDSVIKFEELKALCTKMSDKD